MRILVVEPLRKPKVQDIQDRLESMQMIVGGRIQAVYPFDDPVALVANDEGKLLGLPFNRGLRDEDGALYDIICGTFFICGVSEDEFVSLSPKQIERYSKYFAVPETLVKINGQLAVLPVEPE